MVSKKVFLELVSELRENLSDHHYSEFQVADVPEVGTLYQIMTPRRFMARYICTVSEIPNNLEIASVKELQEKIRVFLTKQYARFPWWKELGTFTVFLCQHNLYEQLKIEHELFRDPNGLHMNVVLGSVFIDKDELESFSTETWGLFYSGKHFLDIKRTTRSWCKEQKKDNVE